MAKMKSDLVTEMREAETEEKHSAKDYKEMMKEAKVSRATNVKALKAKKLQKAETEEKKQDVQRQNDLTIAEIKQLELYLVQIHAECDFLMRNFENRHDAR